MAKRLRLGTRGSALARWQAEWVAAALRERGVEVELCLITTSGDVTVGPLGTSGTTGLFTKEIQRALLQNEVDLAVHSLKDLPTEPVAGLSLAAVPAREACGDALISSGSQLNELPRGARIGTGSLRRRAQLLHIRPDLEMLEIRGNVETRLRKLDEGQFDAIVLAEAGLKRLGLESRITHVLPFTIMLPAIGQGALGIEARESDESTRSQLRMLDDAATHASVTAERALLASLRGGCLAPVGAWGRVQDGEIHLDGAVLSDDGQRRVTASGVANLQEAQRLGEQVATELLRQGAGELIATARRQA